MAEKSDLKFNPKDPLKPGEDENRTYGCRAFNPDFCLNYGSNKCAFFSKDNFCYCPRKGWAKTYQKLKEEK